MKTTLLIPTLNEIDGMRIIIPRIKRGWVDEIVLIDGGSSDGTREFATSSGIKVVTQKNIGKKYGFYEDAMPHCSGDVIITFSPDGNSVPELIPALVKKMQEGHDMVIVSRYLGQAKSEDDDFVTSFGNWLITRMINLIYNAHYTDTIVIFRAWKKEFGEKYTSDKEFEARLSIMAAKLKKKVSEIPGSEPKRIGGKRKLNPIVNGYQIFRLIFTEKFVRN